MFWKIERFASELPSGCTVDTATPARPIKRSLKRPVLLVPSVKAAKLIGPAFFCVNVPMGFVLEKGTIPPLYRKTEEGPPQLPAYPIAPQGFDGRCN